MISGKRNLNKSYILESGVNKLWKLIRGVIIIGICFIILYPVIIRLFNSFMAQRDFVDPAVRYISRHTSFGQIIFNYRVVWEALDYPVSLSYTFVYSLVVSILQLISCTLVGYGLGRFEFKGVNIVFGLVIIALLIPPQLIMVPIFLNFRFFNVFGLFGEEGLNLMGSYWPILLMSLTANGLKNGLFIYIMRQYFKGMPQSLEEAAYVDGAGVLKTFTKVMLPAAGPVLLVVFLFAFVWQWNDLFYTEMLLPGDVELLPMIIQGLNRWSFDFTGHMYSDPTPSYYNSLINLALLFHILPLLFLYGFLQRYFIESIQRTGIVG